MLDLYISRQQHFPAMWHSSNTLYGVIIKVLHFLTNTCSFPGKRPGIRQDIHQDKTKERRMREQKSVHISIHTNIRGANIILINWDAQKLGGELNMRLWVVCVYYSWLHDWKWRDGSCITSITVKEKGGADVSFWFHFYWANHKRSRARKRTRNQQIIV